MKKNKREENRKRERENSIIVRSQRRTWHFHFFLFFRKAPYAISKNFFSLCAEAQKGIFFLVHRRETKKKKWVFAQALANISTDSPHRFSCPSEIEKERERESRGKAAPNTHIALCGSLLCGIRSGGLSAAAAVQ